MKPTLFVIGILGAGFVGAIGGRALFPAEPALWLPDETPDPVEARVAELEVAYARLAEEVRMRPGRAPATAPIRETTGGSVGATPPPDAPAPTASPDGEIVVSDSVIEDKVREVIEERVKAQRAEAGRRAAARQKEKDDAFLGKLEEALGLTDYQRDELGTHLVSRRGMIAEYRLQLKEAGPDVTDAQRNRYRQELTDFIAIQDEELKKLLGVGTFDELMRITTRKR